MEGNVVVFSDSTWAIDKGPKGVAGRFKELTSFHVKDLSLCGGMAARIEKYPSTHSNRSLTSMLFFNEDEESKEMRDSIKEADYVILDYGANDWGASVPASGGENSFENAMQTAVTAVKEMNPDARIVLIGPSEGWMTEGDKTVLRSEIDMGGGTLKDFSNADDVTQKENLTDIFLSNYYIDENGVHYTLETPNIVTKEESDALVYAFVTYIQNGKEKEDER